jgi:lipase maturation factor 1
MPPFLKNLPRWLFASDPATERLVARWLFLRALGLIFFSAFYSLAFQALGLIGADGLLPAGKYLQAVTHSFSGAWRFWYAPTLFWVRSGDRAIETLVWIGLLASVLLVLNVWPRAMIAVCTIVFLSFIGALQVFSSYQSDGMLMGAGFISFFFAPPGFRPGWGQRHPPSRTSWFLLLFEWFTIYFESGIAKISSGDPEWRHLTAMDDYYQNGPLPSWIGWYAQHLPHWFHVGSAGLTLALELVLIWMAVLPRRFRIVLFCIVTPWQLGIILTSNYAFLNYLVLVLGVLLLDDRTLAFLRPRHLRSGPASAQAPAEASTETAPTFSSAPAVQPQTSEASPMFGRALDAVGLALSAFCLTWVFYVMAAQVIWMLVPTVPLPTSPVTTLEPFRIAERYGLFAVMTRGRYEIEFQGSNDDGKTWTPYPFRYKPQDPRKAPRIYAPYQPRFDWNLWFASLDNWQGNRFVLYTEERLLTGSPSVLSLFAGNPFASAPPQQVRAIVYQYWFTDWPEKRKGLWWRRQQLGLYAPQIERSPDGTFTITTLPENGQILRQ